MRVSEPKMGHPLPPAHSCNDRAQCFFDQPVSSKRRSTLRVPYRSGSIKQCLRNQEIIYNAYQHYSLTDSYTLYVGQSYARDLRQRFATVHFLES